MIKKATRGVLGRSVSSRTGVRFHLRQGFGGQAGDFAPSGWGSVRGIHGAAFGVSWSQMQGASQKTMSYIVEEKQRRSWPTPPRTRPAHGSCGWIPRRSSSTMYHIASSSLLVYTSQAPCAQPRVLLGQTPSPRERNPRSVLLYVWTVSRPRTPLVDFFSILLKQL